MRPLRPILPSTTRPRNQPPRPLPRDRVASACDQCRARKIKCNGERPMCVECVKRSTSCHYAARSAETQGQALKRKFDALQAENEAYAELFNLIRSSPDSESHNLVRRVKMGSGVEDVLKRIKEAELLVQLDHKPEAPRLQYTLPVPVSSMQKRMFMPDHPYFALPAPCQAAPDSVKGPSAGGTAAQSTSHPM